MMEVNMHRPTKAIVTAYPAEDGRFDPFCTIAFTGEDIGLIRLFMSDEQLPTSNAIGDIFNGNLPALVSRIEDAMLAVHDADVDFRDYATAIACDLIGKDLDEALRERREAEDAA